MKVKSLFVLGIILVIVGYLFLKNPIDDKIERFIRYEVKEKVIR